MKVICDNQETEFFSLQALVGYINLMGGKAEIEVLDIDKPPVIKTADGFEE